jgi:ATP-dependent DNA helicase RecG
MPASLLDLQGVGPKIAEKLSRLSILSVEHLLFHLPIRYQDRTQLTPIGALKPDAYALVEGEILYSEIAFQGRRVLIVRINDDTGSLNLRFFYFNSQQKEKLSKGWRVRCFGTVRAAGSILEMIHPEYNLIEKDHFLPMPDSLTPIYPTTTGLHQIRIRKLIKQAFLWAEDNWQDSSSEIIESILGKDYPSLLDALNIVHNPAADLDVSALMSNQHIAQQRLIFEELLAHQLSINLLRSKNRQHKSKSLKNDGKLFDKLISDLPFSLTSAQKRTIDEIISDMKSNTPMNRLLQGDVGCGKTLVALAACLMVVENGFQVAFMAPTEILVEQHYRNFSQWLEDLNLKVGLLTGSLNTKSRRTTLNLIRDGKIDIVLGTHALIQDTVKFKNLCLIVIDEQHRFGVHQRMALHDKDSHKHPHQLIMTATPIPRSLAMTIYADLDHSIIDELPPGRKPVTTIAVSESRRHEIVESVKKTCTEKKQVYWICTLIEESDIFEREAAERVFQYLSEMLPMFKVGLLHGRMKSAQKEKTMRQFKNGEINILVATTVIEVGVDVENASLIVIENTERLGMSQLHQLRGRVGRGSSLSTCILVYKSPLSDIAKQRINALRETNNGFDIAQVDLTLRGPGEMFGTRQTGVVPLRIADIVRDQKLLPKVQKTAGEILGSNPESADILLERWLGKSFNLGKV